VKDEKAARDEAAREFTVQKLIEEYLKRRVYGRLRSATDVELRLKRTLASIMERKATEIRRRDLRDLLDAVADAGHKGEAEKRRATVSTMFAWAVGQDICENNPTEGLSSFDGARKARERVLSPDEIVELWQWGETIPPKTAEVLKLQLLLGARVTEVGMMHAAEFSSSDDGRMVWTLPPARSKNKVARTVPVGWNGQGHH
jgi:site-specific recombinase XerD